MTHFEKRFYYVTHFRDSPRFVTLSNVRKCHKAALQVDFGVLRAGLGEEQETVAGATTATLVFH